MTRKIERVFEDSIAVRRRVPLLVGLVGPSSGGKTASALELAHGIQLVTGGDIGAIDTESKRMLHYADIPSFSDKSKTFKFQHLPFGAPFSPLDYLAAIEHFYKKGVKTIIVDSMSHEHEGAGGVLEMHESELDRIAGNDWDKRNRAAMLAWAKPKAERRQLINAILQYDVNFIFCFRAKEKIKMIPGKQPESRGWQPIAGEEFVFEMTLNCLLPPGVNGVPEWDPDEKAERQMIKLPVQFRNILTPGKALSIDIGRQLAQWAEGTKPANPMLQAAIDNHPVLTNQETLPFKDSITNPTPPDIQQVADLFKGQIIDNGASKAFGNPVTNQVDERLKSLTVLMDIRSKYDTELPNNTKLIIDRDTKDNDITIDRIQLLIDKAKEMLGKKWINV